MDDLPFEKGELVAVTVSHEPISHLDNNEAVWPLVYLISHSLCLRAACFTSVPATNLMRVNVELMNRFSQ